ncbi:MAG: DEAD/DEAH box helicase [Bryobacterales bacterium]|nr:DEAD/DEAH box helicase [Bryobacterales bacterium]
MTVALSNDFLLAYSSVQKSHQKKVREFIELFRERPDSPGIHYEPIESAKGKGLYSVRVDQAYRAVVFHPASTVYVLTWVDHHDAAYDWAASKTFQINPLTGALQVLNTEVVESAPVAAELRGPRVAGLFDDVKDKHLLRLGLPETLLPLVRDLRTDADLEKAEKQIPQEAYEALFLLASGYSLDEVFQEVDKRDDEVPVNTGDFVAALQNEDSRRRFYVVDEAKELTEILSAPLEQWRVFLHPKQRKLISMRASGPVRVLGGAGTGKTVVAMHRAQHLAEQVFTGKEDRILVTTFTKNLATDIFENLRKICAAEAMARVEVVNLDAWVSNFLRTQGYRHQVVFDDEGNECWRNALNLVPGELALPESFYRTEWEDVIQAQNITSVEQYVKAARLGRGTRLGRDAKKRIWPVFQEYRAQMNEQGKKEYIDLIRDARSLLETRKITLPYRSVVIDEAQDMSAEAFRLLRAIVPAGENDIFLVGDAHQRIYHHRVTLGQCGINIKGRGKKLKVNYRTTEETRRFAVALLEGRDIDDLDGGQDQQKGYMSLTHGEPPIVRRFRNFGEEAAFVKARIQELASHGASPEAICVVGRTRKVLEAYTAYLRGEGMETYEIRRDAAEQRDKPGVRIATMHRVKGLEFEHMLVVSANKGMVPLDQAIWDGEDAVAKRNAETAERALLYVALTRAKKSASITGFGEFSPFLSGGATVTGV